MQGNSLTAKQCCTKLRRSEPTAGGEPEAAMRQFDARKRRRFDRIYWPEHMRGPVQGRKLLDPFCFFSGKPQLQLSAFTSQDAVDGQLLVKQGKRMSVGRQHETVQCIHSCTQAGMQ